MMGQNRIWNVLAATVALLWLTFTVTVTESSQIRINENGGYENIVVSIGKEVPPISCQTLIQNIQVGPPFYQLAPYIHRFSTPCSSYNISSYLVTHIRVPMM